MLTATTEQFIRARLDRAIEESYQRAMAAHKLHVASVRRSLGQRFRWLAS